ncbi:MAG: hypothetical protein U0R44_05470 [Candidatus Micrarchaeia archaeon]
MEARKPGAGAGAVPPLDHQIRGALAIVLARTEIDGASVSYDVIDVWKRSPKGFPLKSGDPLRIDTGIFRLLGYAPEAGQPVVIFFVSEKSLVKPLEILPATDGTVLYSPHDSSVQEKLSVEEMKRRVLNVGGSGWDIFGRLKRMFGPGS